MSGSRCIGLVLFLSVEAGPVGRGGRGVLRPSLDHRATQGSLHKDAGSNLNAFSNLLYRVMFSMACTCSKCNSNFVKMITTSELSCFSAMGADVVPVCAKGRLQAPRLLATVLHRRGGRAPRIPRCHGQVRQMHNSERLSIRCESDVFA